MDAYIGCLDSRNRAYRRGDTGGDEAHRIRLCRRCRIVRWRVLVDSEIGRKDAVGDKGIEGNSHK